MAKPNWKCLAEIRSAHFLPSSAVLFLVLVVAIGLFTASGSSWGESSAEAGSAPSALVMDQPRVSGEGADRRRRPPPALITDHTRMSDLSTGLVLNHDFTRIFYPRDTEQVVSIGRNNNVQKRAFLSATVFYQPSLTVEEIVHFVGGDPNPQRDMVAMRCLPSDPSMVHPILATWPNVFEAVVSDLGSTYTPSDCPAMPSAPVDRQVYCTALAFSDQANTMAPLSLANAIDTGAAIFQLEGSPFPPTGSTTGADVLFDLYGIGFEFSGLGFSVKNSFLGGKPIPLSAAQVLEQSVVPEYLLDNVPLAQGNCKCIRVKPYTGRDQSPLNWDSVLILGNEHMCTTLHTLP